MAEPERLLLPRERGGARREHRVRDERQGRLVIARCEIRIERLVAAEVIPDRRFPPGR